MLRVEEGVVSMAVDPRIAKAFQTAQPSVDVAALERSTTSLAELGFVNSLLSAKLLAALDQQFGVNLPESLTARSTVASVLELLRDAGVRDLRLR